METAYSPINTGNKVQRIVCPKKNIKKDKSSLHGKRNIKVENTTNTKVLRKFTGYKY